MDALRNHAAQWQLRLRDKSPRRLLRSLRVYWLVAWQAPVRRCQNRVAPDCSESFHTSAVNLYGWPGVLAAVLIWIGEAACGNQMIGAMSHCCDLCMGEIGLERPNQRRMVVLL